jgi:transcription elongation factor/antiterminator RfaH
LNTDLEIGTPVAWVDPRMIAESHANIDRWYAIHTNPKEETRAEQNLKAWNVATFFPKIKERQHKRNKGPMYVTRPLFPRYIFARFKSGELLHKVRFTRGVKSVVGFGEGPTPIRDEVIEVIAAQVGEDGCISFSRRFKPGEKVSIQDGALRNMHGVFERELKDEERVIILLETIRYPLRAYVEPRMLQAT